MGRVSPGLTPVTPQDLHRLRAKDKKYKNPPHRIFHNEAPLWWMTPAVPELTPSSGGPSWYYCVGASHISEVPSNISLEKVRYTTSPARPVVSPLPHTLPSPSSQLKKAPGISKNVSLRGPCVRRSMLIWVRPGQLWPILMKPDWLRDWHSQCRSRSPPASWKPRTQSVGPARQNYRITSRQKLI